MNLSANIGWYPGHMAKAKRYITENMALVDMVIELRDCRIPDSTKNPSIQRIIGEKPKIVALNKASLADGDLTRIWLDHLRGAGEDALAIDCKSLYGINDLINLIPERMKERIDYYQRKGMHGRQIRAMVVGVTNVGKSTFFNVMSRTKKAKTENRPGLTRTTQWIKTPYGVELLDTPGLLWEKIEDKNAAKKLVITGAIRDEVVDTVDICHTLCELLKVRYPKQLAARFKLDPFADTVKGYEIFEQIARKRGFLVSGGEIDEDRCAAVLLEEYRSGKIGRITLETPDEI